MFPYLIFCSFFCLIRFSFLILFWSSTAYAVYFFTIWSVWSVWSFFLIHFPDHLSWSFILIVLSFCLIVLLCIVWSVWYYFAFLFVFFGSFFVLSLQWSRNFFLRFLIYSSFRITLDSQSGSVLFLPAEDLSLFTFFQRNFFKGIFSREVSFEMAESVFSFYDFQIWTFFKSAYPVLL